MVNEIVTVCVGSAGARIGTSFWKQIAIEHGLHPSGLYIGNDNIQLESISTYFDESNGCKFNPRCILADGNPKTLDEIREFEYGDLFKSSNSVFSHVESDGDPIQGMKQIETFVQLIGSIRQEIEVADRVQCLQMFHSSCGGIGGGMTVGLIQQVKDEISSDLKMQTMTHMHYSVFQQGKDANREEQHLYKSMLVSFSGLIEMVDSIVVFNNESIRSNLLKGLNIEYPHFHDINTMIAASVASFTTPFRFRGLEVNNFRKLMRTLSPLPNLRLHTLSFAPTICQIGQHTYSESEEVAEAIVNPENLFIEQDRRDDGMTFMISANVTFRGALDQTVCKKIITKFHEENKENGQFFQWSPEPILWQHHRHAMKQCPLKCGGIICNTQESAFLLENIVSRLGNSRVGKISFISPPWPMENIQNLINSYTTL